MFWSSHPVHSVYFANCSYYRCLSQTSSRCMETWIFFENWNNNLLGSKSCEQWWLGTSGIPQSRAGTSTAVCGAQGPAAWKEDPLHRFVSTTKWEAEAGMLIGTQKQKPSVCLQMFPLPTTAPFSTIKEDFSYTLPESPEHSEMNSENFLNKVFLITTNFLEGCKTELQWSILLCKSAGIVHCQHPPVALNNWISRVLPVFCCNGIDYRK